MVCVNMKLYTFAYMVEPCEFHETNEMYIDKERKRATMLGTYFCYLHLNIPFVCTLYFAVDASLPAHMSTKMFACMCILSTFAEFNTPLSVPNQPH